MAHADSVGLLVGLEVNIGCAPCHAVKHYLIDEPHHRRVVHVGAGDIGILVVVAAELGAIGVHVAEIEGRQGTARRTLQTCDSGFELVLLHDHRFHLKRSPKRNFIQRLQVRRICHTNPQSIAPTHQGEYPMQIEQFTGEQAGRFRAQLNCIQVERRYAKLARGGDGDAAGIALPVRHQVRDQGHSGFSAGLHRCGEVFAGNDAFAEQPPAQSRQRTGDDDLGTAGP